MNKEAKIRKFVAAMQRFTLKHRSLPCQYYNGELPREMRKMLDTCLKNAAAINDESEEV